MDKKVILVTGGSSGIGRSIGTHLSLKGYTVYGTTRNLSKQTEIKDFKLLELDVTKNETITKALHKIIEEEGRIDVLINNAGVGITGPIEETPITEVSKAFDTNFNGPIRTIQAVLPQMRKQRSGLIINITSIAGNMGLPYRGIYSATKGALSIVTEALRMETKEFGVKITDLAPGDFATNIAAGRYHAPAGKESNYNLYGKVLTMINKDVDTAQDPDIVAKKIHSIIVNSNPKVHYSVGEPMQKFSLFLKRILPGRLYEKLLLKHYKL